jgi:hypothetical protein
MLSPDKPRIQTCTFSALEVHTDRWQGRLWRAVIRVWIAGVLGFFFVNRLLESETIRRILHGVVAH